MENLILEKPEILPLLRVNPRICDNSCWTGFKNLNLERMSAKNSFVDFRWRFVRQLQEVDERVTVVAVQPEDALLSGHRHLLHVLGQLDLRLAVDLHQLVDAAQGRLSLAGDWSKQQIIFFDEFGSIRYMR